MAEFISESSRARSRWLGGLAMMPRLEPSLVLFLMFAWTKRERKGADFCRTKVVGPIREMARNPPVVVDVVGSAPTLEVLTQCRSILALHCKSCGQCELRDAAP